MATTGDVEQVRRNTNVDEDDPTHTLAVIGGYVDAFGIAGASAKIWREKAAAYADLVDVSEAGASERLGQLREAAFEMAAYWDEQAATDSGAILLKSRAKTHALDRS